MINHRQLRQRALRAYEIGRLKTSARVLVILLPLGAVCTLLSATPAACAYLAVVIGGLAVFLRWRERRGVQAVDLGVKSGIVPLLVGVALMQLGCSSNPPLCMAVCSIVGMASGAWMGYQLGRHRAGTLVWLSSISVALAIAALGTLDLGLIASVALSVSYVTSGAIVAILVNFRSRPAGF